MKLKNIIDYFDKYQRITLAYKGDIHVRFDGIVFELYDGSTAHDKLLNSEIVRIGGCLFNLYIELEKKGELIK